MAYMSYRFQRRHFDLRPGGDWRPTADSGPPADAAAEEIAVEPCHAPAPNPRYLAMARLHAIVEAYGN
jgi:hypothetical protein